METAAHSLSDDIRALWWSQFPTFKKTETEICYLPDDKRPLFLVIYHPNREKLTRMLLPPEHGCVLDSYIRRECIRFGSLMITPNPYPVQFEHILLICSEHRASPRVSDVVEAVEFSCETGFTLLLNLEGSGASIPEHLHWQGLRIDFPAFREEFVADTVYNDADIKASFLHPPWKGVLLQAATSIGIQRAAKTTAAWTKAINLVIEGPRILLFPRTKHTPSLTPELKFGAAEMAGVVYAKTRSMFEQISDCDLVRAVQEVGMSEGDRDDFKRKLVELLT